MGTKVQSKSCLPGCFSIRDLHEDTNNGDCSRFCNDAPLKNGQYHNGYTPMPAYSNFDKEILRQTMLRHEAIFRKQVAELHRLYRVQRELMNELQGKELCKYPLSSPTPQSASFALHMPSKDDQKTWKMPPNLMNYSCGETTTSATDNQLSSSYFLRKTRMQFNRSTTIKGYAEDHKIWDSRPRVIPKRIFDLQLPADEYIDSDDRVGNGGDRGHKVSLNSSFSMSMSRNPNSEDDVKLILGFQDDQKFSLHHRQTTCVGDLNELPEETTINGVLDSSSFTLRQSVIGHEEISGKKQVGVFRYQEDFFQSSQKRSELWNVPNLTHAENVGHKHESLPSNFAAGPSKTTVKSFFSSVHNKARSSKSVQLTFKTAQEHPLLLSSGQSEKQFWSGEMSSSPTSTSAACSLLGESSPVQSSDSPAYPIMFHWRKSSSSAPQVPLTSCSRSEPVRTAGETFLSAVQRPICTPEIWNNHGSSSWLPRGRPGGYIQDNGYSSDTVLASSKLNLCSEEIRAYENEGGSMPLKYFEGWQCGEIKSHKGMNLELCPSNGLADDLKQIHKQADGEGILGVPVTAPSWFQTEVTNMQLNSGVHIKSHPPLLLSRGGGACEAGNAQISNSTFDLNMLYEPLEDQSQKEDHIKETIEGVFPDVGLFSNLPLGKSEKQLNGASHFRCDLNLNVTASSRMDQITSLMVTSGNIAETSAKVASQIDLEAPAVSHEEKCLMGDPDCSDSEDVLAKIAAEAIIAFSAALTSNSADGACGVSQSLICVKDSLDWLAEVISSLSGTLQVARSEHRASSEFDSFELMTLKLPESNTEECCSKPRGREDGVEETSPGTLSTGHRRGGHMRGRQRRDFQRDILPGLASLSRHEVTEDLQTLGGLMRASGYWTGFIRRNPRNGWSCPSKTRRRRRGSSPMGNEEVDLDVLNLQGWGKTTRRAPRQRCSTGNIATFFNLKIENL